MIVFEKRPISISMVFIEQNPDWLLSIFFNVFCVYTVQFRASNTHTHVLFFASKSHYVCKWSELYLKVGFITSHVPLRMCSSIKICHIQFSMAMSSQPLNDSQWEHLRFILITFHIPRFNSFKHFAMTIICNRQWNSPENLIRSPINRWSSFLFRFVFPSFHSITFYCVLNLLPLLSWNELTHKSLFAAITENYVFFFAFQETVNWVL